MKSLCQQVGLKNRLTVIVLTFKEQHPGTSLLQQLQQKDDWPDIVTLEFMNENV